MNLLKYVNVFHDLAYAHPLLLHRPNANPSFFTSEKRMAETISVVPRSTAYILQLLPPSGYFEYQSELFNVITGEFRILKKGGDISETDTNILIQEECEDLGHFICGWLNDLYERYPHDGPVAGFDINSVKYQHTGPILDNYYGVTFKFNLKSVPFNIYDAGGRHSKLSAGLQEVNLVDYLSTFGGFAYAHPDILHREVENPSFFATEELLQRRVFNDERSSDYLLQMLPHNGILQFESEVFNAKRSGYLVLCKGGELSEETRNKGVQGKALEIGFMLAGWLHDMHCEHPYSGPVAGFDINSVTWKLVGPVMDLYYGVEFGFTIKSIPFDFYDSAGRTAVLAEGLAHRIFDHHFALEFE